MTTHSIWAYPAWLRFHEKIKRKVTEGSECRVVKVKPQERLLDLSSVALCTRLEASPCPSPWWAASSSSPPSSSTSSSPTPPSRRPWRSTSKPKIPKTSLLLLPRNAVKPSIRNAVSKPGILIALFKVGSAACSLGFLQTTLEPHLSTLKPALSSFQVEHVPFKTNPLICMNHHSCTVHVSISTYKYSNKYV